MERREFMKSAAAAAAVTGLTTDEVWAVPAGGEYELEHRTSKTDLMAACPYGGVGCGTIIQTKNGRITNIVPDKDHPTNKGLQCIKGLTSAEAIYVDRLTVPLIRKDMSDPLRGHVFATKGSFDRDLFREASWEEAEEYVADRIVEIVKASGGNAVGLYGSGQLTVEGQWLENLFMKGVLGSNTIEANARMCMTSVVTGYMKSLGSDTPPSAYADIKMADMITFWGHNARGAHSIVYWRVADHKAKTGIATLVVDPRRTGTVMGLEDINPDNSFHFPTINGDISIHNALAFDIMEKHPDAVDWDLLRNFTTGWETYVEQVKAGYETRKVEDRTMIPAEQICEVAEKWAEASIKGRERGRGGVLSFWASATTSTCTVSTTRYR